VGGLTQSVGYVSNGSRSDCHKPGLDLRRVADIVPGCILVADAYGRALYANRRLLQMPVRDFVEKK
jgi:hypothetical protein